MSKRSGGSKRRQRRTRQRSDGLARPVEDSQKAYRFGIASAAYERLRAQVASTPSGNMGLRPKVVKHLRELKAQREKDHTHRYLPSKGCTWKCACGDTFTAAVSSWRGYATVTRRGGAR